jgi:hypothetical protein
VLVRTGTAHARLNLSNFTQSMKGDSCTRCYIYLKKLVTVRKMKTTQVGQVRA